MDVFYPDHPVPEVKEQIVFLSPFYNKNGVEALAHTKYFVRKNGQMTFYTATHHFQKSFRDPEGNMPKAKRMVENIIRRMLERE